MKGGYTLKTLKVFTKDKLTVKFFANREILGKNAGNDIADKIRELLKTKNEINMIFAAAPSQNETLDTLILAKNIEWNKINAFHMDEYVGLDKNASQGFGNFLRNKLFERLPFKSIHYIDGQCKNPQEECERYSELLNVNIDIVCMGIGENCHVAFNDPGEADFNDKKAVKIITLDKVCRMQQVNDGCFKEIVDVPKKALSLTIPSLFKSEYIFCMVPAKTKAWAVNETVNGEISEDCPSSILRRHNNTVLYCDSDSGKHLLD